MELLTIYYADSPDKLINLQAKTTFWLPEHDISLTNEEKSSMYTIGNTIATTRDVRETLEILIQGGAIPHDRVIWINCTTIAVAHTFGPSGQIENFFILGEI